MIPSRAGFVDKNLEETFGLTLNQNRALSRRTRGDDGLDRIGRRCRIGRKRRCSMSEAYVRRNDARQKVNGKPTQKSADSDWRMRKEKVRCCAKSAWG